MRTLRVAAWMVLFSAVVCIGDRRLLAQPDAAQTPAAPPTVCTQEVIECPDAYHFPSAVGINLTPVGGVCRFEEPRDIQRLELSTGQNVSWTFCNECGQDMVVQLDTSSPGPFKSFQFFRPRPAADNLVSIDVGCHSYGSAVGSIAQHAGTWKYSLRAKPAGSTTFPDEIDPELVIDDFFVPPTLQTPMWLVAGAIVGAILGYWLARRARSAV